MVSYEEIELMIRKIVRELDPERIVLFGSYAIGEVTEDSDIDLLVVMKTSLPYAQRYAAVRGLLKGWPASFDIVVKSPEEYQRWRNVLNSIVYFADKYGKTLYER